MEIPVCKDSYSNVCNGHCVEFLKDYNVAITEYIRNNHRPFFVSLCFYCHSPGQGSPESTLYRCGGCQLVSYCSRYCQKNDRSSHKYMCKEFPVINGKNALYTTRPWKNHIATLRKRADKLPQAEVYVKPIFRNPRVCCIWQESRPEHLTDCKTCGSVSYCSERCKRVDKEHRDQCPQLTIIRSTYTLGKMHYFLPSVTDITLRDEYKLVTNWDDILTHIYREQQEKLCLAGSKKYVDVESFWTKERLSYPMSLLYALQSLSGCYLGQDQDPLEELTTLTIHVIISNPHLDSIPWEVFMHLLPKLHNLNIVFIIQGIGQKQSYGFNTQVTIGRCIDCRMKQRAITYSVHQMLYHMFFSSAEYTEPDVVVIYGNTNEMPSNGDGEIHSKISYRNITNSKDTVLVLMDTQLKLVMQGAEEVANIRPVDILVPPSTNPLKGFSSNRDEIESDSLIINEKSYFACLRKR